jgi:hypothetical protein
MLFQKIEKEKLIKANLPLEMQKEPQLNSHSIITLS